MRYAMYMMPFSPGFPEKISALAQTVITRPLTEGCGLKARLERPLLSRLSHVCDFCTDPNDASDFQLDKFLAGPCETFDPFYGNGNFGLTFSLSYLHMIPFAHHKNLLYIIICCDTGVRGYDGDGDITKTDNLLELQEYVMDQTEGVHFVMADGVSPV